jgi:hypothetical protein
VAAGVEAESAAGLVSAGSDAALGEVSAARPGSGPQSAAARRRQAADERRDLDGFMGIARRNWARATRRPPAGWPEGRAITLTLHFCDEVWADRSRAKVSRPPHEPSRAGYSDSAFHARTRASFRSEILNLKFAQRARPRPSPSPGREPRLALPTWFGPRGGGLV